MKRCLVPPTLGFFSCVALFWSASAQEPATKAKIAVQTAVPSELADFRTVETAATTKIKKGVAASAGQAGYLGVHTVQSDGKIVVDSVADESPAANAGLKAGDVLERIEDQPVATPDALADMLLSKNPGDAIKLALSRQGKPMELSARLASVSRPMKLPGQRAVLGVQVCEPKDSDDAPITSVTAGSSAASAGLKVGDLLLKVDGLPVSSPAKLRDILSERKPGDEVAVLYRRGDKEAEINVSLAEDQGKGGFGKKGGGWDNRSLGAWKKNVYRLAVVAIEYPDAKHNPKVKAKDWEESLFSDKTYLKASATGQKVFGSMNDYYQEQSFGNLRVTGKAFDWVTVGKKRNEYSQGTRTANKSALLVEAVDKLLERDGKDALKDFDGIFFLYAGGRVQTNRGGLYWPHRASFRHLGKSWPYFICPEGGERMGNISVICHEFGHMLGLPDLYARPENPGSEGVGVWCAMSNQVGNGRPQHFSAWSKEQLGWIKPIVIDPTVKQKIILAPIEDSAKECIKVLVRPDGSEYLLLENRRKKGFDTELPGEGLLIWRVVQNRLILEESHGVDGPSGPRVFVGSVPFPSAANNAFTPHTTPSSRSQLGGGLPVYITNIRKLPDGRITFHIGYKYL
ncbi:MAG: M6 family metalloprotease domain-containing protein [Gemmataceae bacterium]|nr:M6 family metalloprotease domain-containing protein [Gemmataceae bacterium]MCI0741389.1 M6 family metalloprotease domain-containing protein [Gemmataceae bacterium]